MRRGKASKNLVKITNSFDQFALKNKCIYDPQNSYLLRRLQAFPETNFPPDKRLNDTLHSKLLKTFGWGRMWILWYAHGLSPFYYKFRSYFTEKWYPYVSRYLIWNTDSLSEVGQKCLTLFYLSVTKKCWPLWYNWSLLGHTSVSLVGSSGHFIPQEERKWVSSLSWGRGTRTQLSCHLRT